MKRPEPIKVLATELELDDLYICSASAGLILPERKGEHWDIMVGSRELGDENHDIEPGDIIHFEELNRTIQVKSITWSKDIPVALVKVENEVDYDWDEANRLDIIKQEAIEDAHEKWMKKEAAKEAKDGS